MVCGGAAVAPVECIPAVLRNAPSLVKTEGQGRKGESPKCCRC